MDDIIWIIIGLALVAVVVHYALKASARKKGTGAGGTGGSRGRPGADKH